MEHARIQDRPDSPIASVGPASGEHTAHVDLLLRALPVPLLLLDLHGTIDGSNAAADRLFEPARDAPLAGRRFRDLLEIQSASRFDHALARVRENPHGDAGFTQLLVGRRPEGDGFPVGIVVSNVGQDAPELLVLLRAPSDTETAHRDLTDRESVLAAAVEAAQLGVWEHNLRTDRMIWGGHYREILMPTPGRFDGTFAGLMQLVHPDDREALRALSERAQAKATHYAHEFRVIWPDGQTRWVHVWGQFYPGADGRSIRSVGAFRDVTGQRGLQRQLAQAQKIEAIGQLAAGIAHEINTPTQYVSDNLALPPRGVRRRGSARSSATGRFARSSTARRESPPSRLAEIRRARGRDRLSLSRRGGPARPWRRRWRGSSG